MHREKVCRFLQSCGPTVLLCALLLTLFAANIPLLRDAIRTGRADGLTATELRDTLTASYQENVSGKNAFIDLNGLFVRLTGGRICNEVVRLNNGMLSSVADAEGLSNISSSIAALSAALQEQDIPFLFVQTPYKLDRQGQLLPDGVEDPFNALADDVVAGLRESGTPVLDLRDTMAAMPEDIEKNFYRTDHHWTPVAAFSAFQQLSAYLQEVFPDQPVCGEAQQWESWDIHTKAGWFLGSRGKRTGRFFGGVDDLIWMTPKFDTEMSLSVNGAALYRGDFSAANIRPSYIDTRDYFGANAYWVYIGGEYALVQHRNAAAPVDKRLLIVKDSFALPLQAYLSTVFSEIDAVDLRAYKDGTLADYIRDTAPDMVLVCYNPSLDGSKRMASFGDVSHISDVCTAAETVFQANSLQISSDDAQYWVGDTQYWVGDPQYWHEELAPTLRRGEQYTLHIDSVDVLAGSAEGLTVALYGDTSKKFFLSVVCDISYCTERGGFTWTFTVPDTADAGTTVLLYSGIRSQTAGNSILLRNVTLVRNTSASGGAGQ